MPKVNTQGGIFAKLRASRKSKTTTNGTATKQGQTTGRSGASVRNLSTAEAAGGVGTADRLKRSGLN